MSTPFYAGNRFLTAEEQTVNARYIFERLRSQGWSAQAVCAMLGNMQTESTINPAIWQNLTEGDSSLGFGLVQWTPSTKYTSWCSEQGLDPAHMDSALARIEYELENGLQWIETDSYPLTFYEFKTSVLDVGYLADAFLNNYERPAEMNQPARAEQARAWYTLLNGSETGSEPSKPKRKGLSLLLLFAGSRR